MSDLIKNSRIVKPPTGDTITAKSWSTEAPMRMLMNNLHPDVAENPNDLLFMGVLVEQQEVGKILIKLFQA